MKPKERALDLLCLFECETCPNGENGRNNMTKKCALICVDIILNDVGAKNWENDSMTGNNYWLEVKKEIELL